VTRDKAFNLLARITVRLLPLFKGLELARLVCRLLAQRSS